MWTRGKAQQNKTDNCSQKPFSLSSSLARDVYADVLSSNIPFRIVPIPTNATHTKPESQSSHSDTGQSNSVHLNNSDVPTLNGPSTVTGLPEWIAGGGSGLRQWNSERDGPAGVILKIYSVDLFHPTSLSLRISQFMIIIAELGDDNIVDHTAKHRPPTSPPPPVAMHKTQNALCMWLNI